MRCLMGSQCRCIKTGVMCSLVFVLVISLDAAFWTLYSLLRWMLGIPKRTQFMKSSFENTNPCMSLSEVSWLKYCLIMPIFRRANQADLQVWLIWVCIHVFMVLSIVAPVFLSWVDDYAMVTNSEGNGVNVFFGRFWIQWALFQSYCYSGTGNDLLSTFSLPQCKLQFYLLPFQCHLHHKWAIYARRPHRDRNPSCISWLCHQEAVCKWWREWARVPSLGAPQTIAPTN